MAEMLSRISSRELLEWKILYGLELMGEERADYRAGIVAATVANSTRDSKKHRKPYRPQDFMPYLEKPRQSWQDQLRIVEQLNAAFNGLDQRPVKRERQQ